MAEPFSISYSIQLSWYCETENNQRLSSEVESITVLKHTPYRLRTKCTVVILDGKRRWLGIGCRWAVCRSATVYRKVAKCNSQYISSRTVLSVGCISLVLLAWHLNVVLRWCLFSRGSDSLLMMTLSAARSSLPSVSLSFMNQLTVGRGSPAQQGTLFYQGF